MDAKLDWRPHINNVVAKANQKLAFIRRNLSAINSLDRVDSSVG